MICYNTSSVCLFCKVTSTNALYKKVDSIKITKVLLLVLPPKQAYASTDTLFIH